MTDATTLQTRLQAAGYDPGPVDGIAGRRTFNALFCYVAGRDLGERGYELAAGAVKHFPPHEVNTPLRQAHFLGQVAHETMRFAALHELWGPTRAQKRYQGNRGLGNTMPGDGYRYRGRGLLMVTGRWNYARYSKVCGVDLVSDPDKAEDPDIAMHISCSFWQEHGCNELADRDAIVTITRAINGGLTGLDERKALIERAKRVLMP